MKLITRDTDYGIRAICYLARRGGEVVSVAELVEALGVPRPFLRKILQLLHHQGMLKAYKGQGGGFSLAISPAKISLVGVMRVFQGRFSLNQCLLKKAFCPRRDYCGLRKKILAVERRTFRDLNKITIGSLLRG